MSTQIANIESLLPWGAPEPVQTEQGERMVRKFPLVPGHEFWRIWKLNKQTLYDAGVRVAPVNGQWEARWWQAATAEERALEQKRWEEEQEELREALDGKPAKLTEKQERRLLKLEPKLLGYQPPSVRRLAKALHKYSGAIDASDTGTGKTYTALAACAVLERPIFVVCPKAVRPSWKKAAKHFGITIQVINYELLRRGEQAALEYHEKEKPAEPAPDPAAQPQQPTPAPAPGSPTPGAPPVKFTGGNRDKAQVGDYEWHLAPDTIIIFDESHRMKDHRTLNCAMGLAALQQGYTVLAISATAADNPLQMKFVGRVAKCFKTDAGFLPWCRAHGVRRNRWGMEFTGGKPELNAIHKQIFPLHGTRIRIADLGDAFPETQITAECYDTNGMASKIQAAYDDMQAEIAKLEASVKMDAQTLNACILTELLRARQRAEILKVPAIAEMARDAVDSGMSVAIFVNFEDSLDGLCNKLATKCCIRGGQSDNAREENIQAFQADKEPIIICNIRAGGVGVSLHGTPEARTRLAIICPTWSGQDLKQALGRVHRANGAKSIQRIFFAAGTIEEDICKQVNEKISRIDTLNDGDLSIGGTRRYEEEKQSRPAEVKEQVDKVEIILPEAKSKDAKPRTAKQEQLDKIAEKLTPELMMLAHDGMKVLAAMDPDHASEENAMGFSQMDGAFGHSLANAITLTPRMAASAAMLCRKYRRQLGSKWQPIYNVLSGEANEPAAKVTAAGRPARKKEAKKVGKLGGLQGYSTVAVLRTMGAAGWKFHEAKEVLERNGVEAADNTVRIQLRAGKLGVPGAPIDINEL